MIIYEDENGDEWLLVSPEASITDILNRLIFESGFDEVETVLDQIIEDAVRQSEYEDNR